MTTRRLNQLAKAGLPKTGRNKFNLDIACKWIHTYERKRLREEVQLKKEESNYWIQNARLIRLKANKEQDEELVRRKQLIESEKLKPWLDRLIGSFKEAMLGLSSRLESQIGPDPARVVNEEMRKQLNLLADQSRQLR